MTSNCLQPEGQPPEVLAPKFSPDADLPKFLDINPTELSRQMTLISRQLFESVNSKGIFSEFSELTLNIRDDCIRKDKQLDKNYE